MKLKLYSLLMSGCDIASCAIRAVEIPVQSLRIWAWTRSTDANLKSCGDRIVRHRL